ncbi:unnamed protein product [Rotaria magnacalcarata]|uniref:Uncharacterized protein n=1 Tax=Rotaria magnacalcarata TaxID=392030 RepID=A0A820M280_9BILA|nr:unnamed protein product [Rotaria magnacalcarata]CAF4191519.1 unnamed protein product [Rotaria magnacalcarata]CAF4365871.1 unnamed protein product [Rotaria magnacalcarata]
MLIENPENVQGEYMCPFCTEVFRRNRTNWISYLRVSHEDDYGELLAQLRSEQKMIDDAVERIPTEDNHEDAFVNSQINYKRLEDTEPIVAENIQRILNKVKQKKTR